MCQNRKVSEEIYIYIYTKEKEKKKQFEPSLEKILEHVLNF